MSQRNVERLLGRLLTDEALRERFLAGPEKALGEFIAEGWPLTDTERAALSTLDQEALARFASEVDPRIRKASLDWRRGESREV